MYKIIGILVVVCLLAGATGDLRVTSEPEVKIMDPSENCWVYFGHYPTTRYDVPTTEIIMSCKLEDISSTSVIWRAEGDYHQIKLEWLGANKLKVAHPSELKIMLQIGSFNRAYNEIKIEYEPPWQEKKRDKENVLDESEWPLKCDEAATYIYSKLDEEDLQILKNTKKSDLIKFHFGWGMGIRNSLGLWRGNNNLMKSCLQKEPNTQNHPDSVSMIIIRLVWEKTHKE